MYLLLNRKGRLLLEKRLMLLKLVNPNFSRKTNITAKINFKKLKGKKDQKNDKKEKHKKITNFLIGNPKAFASTRINVYDLKDFIKQSS